MGRFVNPDNSAFQVALKDRTGQKFIVIMQIKDRKYPSSILGYTGEILLVGINYDKNSKEHQCVIEKYAL